MLARIWTALRLPATSKSRRARFSQKLAFGFLFAHCLPISTSSQTLAKHSVGTRAEVRLLSVDHRTLSLIGKSVREFVVVAVSDSSLVLNGEPIFLKAGEHKTFLRQRHLQLSQSGENALPVVVVEVLAWKQELTIERCTLTAHQQQEDASDRNATLLIAITAVKLKDERNSGKGDDGPWIAGSKRNILLTPGASTWLKAGEHRIQNLRDTAAQFVTVEW